MEGNTQPELHKSVYENSTLSLYLQLFVSNRRIRKIVSCIRIHCGNYTLCQDNRKPILLNLDNRNHKPCRFNLLVHRSD